MLMLVNSKLPHYTATFQLFKTIDENHFERLLVSVIAFAYLLLMFKIFKRSDG